MRYVTTSRDYRFVTQGAKRFRLYNKDKIDAFNASLLKLGNLDRRSAVTPAICAVFDLKGFTHFCSQTEPELVVSPFMRDFLEWFFESIKDQTISKAMKDGYRLFHDLPFFTKFLGDGALVLWNTKEMTRQQQHNIIVSMSNICVDYQETFLPQARKQYMDPPSALRCGIARGSVYSIGDRNDFVGPCINLASRLQHLAGLTFAFARKGFEPETGISDFTDDFILLKAEIRGLASKEIVGVYKSEFEALSARDSKAYEQLST